MNANTRETDTASPEHRTGKKYLQHATSKTLSSLNLHTSPHWLAVVHSGGLQGLRVSDVEERAQHPYHNCSIQPPKQQR